MLVRVFQVYHFAAGSFAKGEPEPEIHGWVLYIYVGHNKAQIALLTDRYVARFGGTRHCESIQLDLRLDLLDRGG